MFERIIERAHTARIIGLIALLMAPTCSVAAEKAEKAAKKADERAVAAVATLSDVRTHGNTQRAGLLKNGTLWLNLRAARGVSVSYTHLTLPTKRIV